ncbi:hypothetical protein D3C84_1044170 [compost metagenome]
MCRRRVHDNASRLQPAGELLDHVIIVRMNDGRVAHAAEFDHFYRTADALLRIFYLITGEHRTQLLRRQRIRLAYSC